MTRRLIVLLSLAALLVSGCATGPAALDAAQVAAAAQGTLQVIGTALAIGETQTATQLWPTPTHTPTVTPSPTDTPTATPTPTDTVTPTATNTPLPSGTVLSAIRLRSGPGLEYPGGAQLAGGETATPLGRTAATGWLLIALADGTQGWLLADKFELALGSPDLPIITDLPPTPTLPPPPTATLTPVPTVTSSPSPWTCDFSITASVFPGHVILSGSGWPPDQDVLFSFNGNSGYIFLRTGGDNSPTPNGFWATVDFGPGAYTLSTEGCSRTVNYP